MKPEERNYIIYLEDMYQSMSRIIEYIDDKGFSDFKKNYMLVDAVIRNLEIIGEAANNIPKSIRVKYPSLPWKKMYGLRNLIAHEYFGIDYEMIWEVARNNLPENIVDLRRIIDEEKDTGSNSI